MYSVNLTPKNTKTYPLHRHNQTEIMLYFNGNGKMLTEIEDYSFEYGTIIIVPKEILHGSTSEDTFCNLSIGGTFPLFPEIKKPIVLKATDDIISIGKIISKNRFEQNDYAYSLIETYLLAILQVMKIKTKLDETIETVISNTIQNCNNPDFDIVYELKKSGYAEDYIRSVFRKRTNMRPLEFLANMRINNACRLLKIYETSLPIAEIAYKCGYQNPVYFSKQFKFITGLSPSEFRKGNGNNNVSKFPK